MGMQSTRHLCGPGMPQSDPYRNSCLQLALRQAVRVRLHRAGPGQEDHAIAGLRQTGPQSSSCEACSTARMSHHEGHDERARRCQHC